MFKGTVLNWFNIQLKGTVLNRFNIQLKGTVMNRSNIQLKGTVNIISSDSPVFIFREAIQFITASEILF